MKQLILINVVMGYNTLLTNVPAYTIKSIAGRKLAVHEYLQWSIVANQYVMTPGVYNITDIKTGLIVPAPIFTNRKHAYKNAQRVFDWVLNTRTQAQLINDIDNRRKECELAHIINFINQP